MTSETKSARLVGPFEEYLATGFFISANWWVGSWNWDNIGETDLV